MRSSLLGIFYQNPFAAGCYLALPYQTLASACKVNDVTSAIDSNPPEMSSGTLGLKDSLKSVTTTIRQSLMKHPDGWSIHRL
jgi:hypothetical protein